MKRFFGVCIMLFIFMMFAQEVVTTVDPMTDEESTVYHFSCIGADESMSFEVVKKGKHPVVNIYPRNGYYVPKGRHKITARFDDGKPKNYSAGAYKDGETVFVVYGPGFIKKMLESKKVVIKTVSSGGKVAYGTFDISTFSQNYK